MTHADLPARTDVWDDAPCGLIQLDRRFRVVHANARFFELTGYTPTDVQDGLGLAGMLAPAARILFETQLAPMLRLNGVLDEVLVDLACPDGTRVPVLLNARLIDERAGALAVVVPVPDRLRYEQQLREARAAAEEANRANVAARRRLEFLARASQALVSSLDVDAALARLADVLVTELADWCLIYALDRERSATPTQWAVAHVDPDRLAVLERLALLLPANAAPGSSLKRVLDGGPAVLLPTLSAADLSATTTSDEVADLYTQLDVRSAMVVPSNARALQTAVIVLGRASTTAAFTTADLDDATDLAARTGIAIDNLRLYAREHSASVALQQALLTSPPRHDELEIAIRYRPGENRNEVGGDWYDAFLQPDGTMVVVIGDVVGHDIVAAASMGQLRGVIRTVGYTVCTGAAQTLAAADRAAAGLGVGVLATAVLARLLKDPGDADTYVLEWANAGHPPPIVVRAGGAVEILAHANDPLLGAAPERERHDRTAGLSRGDTLLLYTDGLVERRDEGLDDSIARLARALSGAPDRSADQLCTTALDSRAGRSGDDVAMIAVRVTPGATSLS